MKSAPLPKNENIRLELLHRYRILDTPPEETYDRITRLVAKAIGVPITLVSLVDENRQWFKSRFGIDAVETPRDIAFCAHAILGDDVFVVEDATKDDRFHDNPLVIQDPSIRFYAGAPLTTSEGIKIGTLCAIDRTPRSLTPDQENLLRDLARVVMDEMELRRALQEALNELANETEKRHSVNDFLSFITHELRTPLTSIRGSMGLIDNQVFGELPKEVAELIKVANKNAETLMNLVNDLLDTRQMEAGKFNYDFKPVNFGKLLLETCERMQGYCSEKKIRLEHEIDVLPVMLVDPDRISQAIINLLSNAIKFSPPGEKVLLRAIRQGDIVNLEVIDHGPGIPEELRPHLFQQFAQGKNRKSGTKGTGLGLNITKGIVEAHGGTISVESETGKGTTFHISLPVRLQAAV